MKWLPLREEKTCFTCIKEQIEQAQPQLYGTYWPYVFTSQRSSHLTEDGIHHWFRTLKRQANREEWELIADLSFHDLRHDFAHRAREAGWTLEEVAYYLGHVTMRGTC